MAEYINKETLYAKLDSKLDGRPMEDTVPWLLCMSIVRKFPAADVVEVVRCKDCIHYDGRLCHNPNTFDDEKTAGNTTDMWYCADGEKKNG